MRKLHEIRKNHDSVDPNSFFQRQDLPSYSFSKFFRYFIEIIIVSFACEECGYKNNEVQSGGKLADFGTKITFTLIKSEDLSRDVVKSEFATILIPELEFEVPPSKKGYLNTIEGFLNNYIDELLLHQEERKVNGHLFF